MSFFLGCIFWGATAIFPIFHNGQQQFSMDTFICGELSALKST